MSVVPCAQLRAFAHRALSAAGMPREHADWTADAMMWADLRGLPAHGVGGKLPQCLARIREGGTSASPRLKVLTDLGASLSLDADDAWGQVAGVAAMNRAIERAGTFGVGLVSVRQASSAAAMGHYAWLAATAGLIGFALTNGPALIAAPGGRHRVVGNQGHAIACPGGANGPLIYDSATTTMSTGAMETAKERGELLPEGVLRDHAGRPTRDPEAWLTGLLEPMGGHRGFAFSIGLEVLTGLLSGGERYGADVGMPGAHGRAQSVSLLMLAIDPALAQPEGALEARVAAYAEVVRSSGADGEVPHLPGERGNALAEKRRETGIPLSVAKIRQLDRIAAQLSVQPIGG